MKRLQRRLRYLLAELKRIRRQIRKAQTKRPTGLSRRGAEFIAEFEGFSATPYNDPAGHATIGYGTLLHMGNVTSTDRKEWGSITHDRAIRLLQNEADNAWRVIEDLVDVRLTQNQADALISFAYNCGVGALMSSSLLKQINAKAGEKAIRYEFSRWVKADGKTLPGLVRRREAEADLYFTP